MDLGIGLALFLHCIVALDFIICILFKKKKLNDAGVMGGGWLSRLSILVSVQVKIQGGEFELGVESV